MTKQLKNKIKGGNQKLEDHLVEVNEMVFVGSGEKREMSGVKFLPKCLVSCHLTTVQVYWHHLS